MYRNWSAKIPSGPSLGMLISGTNRIGLLGSEIVPATGNGDYGGGILANDQLVPNRRYRLLLEQSTFADGTFVVTENGSGEFTENGTATFGVFEDTVRLGASTFVGTIASLTAVQSDLALSYSVRNAVQSDLALAYGVRTFAQSDLTLSYLIQQNGVVFSDLTLAYEILPGAAPADPTNSLETIYLRSPVSYTVNMASSVGDPTVRQLMNTQKIYVGDTGTAFRLDTEVSLAGTEQVNIFVRKPNGTEVLWPGVADGTVIVYSTQAADLDQPGTWRLQARVTTPSGQWLGATARIRVFDEFK